MGMIWEVSWRPGRLCIRVVQFQRRRRSKWARSRTVVVSVGQRNVAFAHCRWSSRYRTTSVGHFGIASESGLTWFSVCFCAACDAYNSGESSCTGDLWTMIPSSVALGTPRTVCIVSISIAVMSAQSRIRRPVLFKRSRHSFSARYCSWTIPPHWYSKTRSLDSSRARCTSWRSQFRQCISSFSGIGWWLARVYRHGV
ncbi:hypothetical protein PLICRDRAFT_356770 [Plicaturopsis crispa FD-325 SS-3]|uniref:Uncharacterized protein n=1 Tax=Plicaturopsis crispa FD-325 SS-3 TaxID=944288 RepID=A0A0C9SRH1_PLICR|nr:hypothetical protein PLICRDRAFT_356770 [Plicaturopsis crispa FD-325 SS-3]